jgi:hypothetical protein
MQDNRLKPLKLRGFKRFFCILKVKILLTIMGENVIIILNIIYRLK